MGVGSEVFGALTNDRRGVGVELKESYYRQASKNIARQFPGSGKTLPFTDEEWIRRGVFVIFRGSNNENQHEVYPTVLSSGASTVWIVREVRVDYEYDIRWLLLVPERKSGTLQQKSDYLDKYCGRARKLPSFGNNATISRRPTTATSRNGALKSLQGGCTK